MQTGTREIHIFHCTRCIQPVEDVGQFPHMLDLNSPSNSIKEKGLKPFVRKASNHLLMCEPLGYTCQEAQNEKRSPLLALNKNIHQ